MAAALAYRAVLHACGFDAYGHTIGRQEHFLDPAWLAADPVGSLLHLHSQPPLMNALVWMASVLPGGTYPNLLLLNAVAAITTACTVWWFARPITGRWPAGALAIGYLAMPGAILATAHPDYAVLTAAGYAGVLLAFSNAARAPRRAWLLLTASLIWLVFLRASFSPLHALACCAAFAWWSLRDTPARSPIRRTCIAITATAALALPIKNGVLYDSWGTSSWLPLNLALGWHTPMDPSGLDPMAEPAQLVTALPHLRCEHAYSPVDTALVMPNGYANFNSCLTLAHARAVAPRVWRHYSVVAHSRWVLRYTLAYFDRPDMGYEWRDDFSPRSQVLFGALTSALDRAWITVRVTPFAQVRLLMLGLLAWLAAFALRTRQPFLLVTLGVLVTHLATHVLTDGSSSSTFAFDVAWVYVTLVGWAAASLTATGRVRLALLGRAQRSTTASA